MRFSPQIVIKPGSRLCASLGNLVDPASLFEDAVDEFCVLVRYVKLAGSF